MPFNADPAPQAHGDLYAIAGAIEPTRLSIAYRAGLIVVAMAMLLLPLVYVGLIVAVGYFTWWHLTTDVGMLRGRGGMQWRLIGYLAPAVIGVVVTFFMIKPLLARPAKGLDPTEVDPDREPVLFAFVQQICRLIGAPIPRRVLVDCQVNASAGLRGVLARDLTLTIGLPLAAGLSIRELGGILAHEFGHFAQGGGMRLTVVVRSINAWFARVVYERDAWDEMLEEHAQRSDYRLGIVLALARGAVWVSRRVLHGLMLAGHAISCFMMRQMEYDADSYEVKLAGVDTFTSTSVRLRELGVASQLAYGDLRDGLTSGSMPSNLPAFVASSLGRIPAGVTEQIRKTPEHTSGMFDTHPSDAERLRAARAVGSAGVLVGGEAPATGLFAAFESLCATATRHHYEHDLGLDPDRVTLVSTDAAAVESRTREARRRALHQIFGGCLSALRPLQIPPMDLSLQELVTTSEAARTTMSGSSSNELAARYRRLEAIKEEWRNAVTAECLFEVGFTQLPGGSFGLTQGTRDEATKILATVPGEASALTPHFVAFDQAASRRLSSGLALTTHLPRPGDDPGDTAEPIDCVSLVTAFNAVSRAMPSVEDIRRVMLAARVVQGTAADHPDPIKGQRVLGQLDARIQAHVGKIREAVRSLPAPPGVPSESSSLADLCGLAPTMSSEQAAACAERTGALYFDLLGHVASLVLEAEQSPATTAAVQTSAEGAERDAHDGIA